MTDAKEEEKGKKEKNSEEHTYVLYELIIVISINSTELSSEGKANR